MLDDKEGHISSPPTFEIRCSDGHITFAKYCDEEAEPPAGAFRRCFKHLYISCH